MSSKDIFLDESNPKDSIIVLLTSFLESIAKISPSSLLSIFPAKTS